LKRTLEENSLLNSDIL